MQASYNEGEIKKILDQAASVAESVLVKLENFIKDHKDKMEKATSLKTLVLLLKPLEEAIKMAGSENKNLPYEWRERVSLVLKMMGAIFPLAKTPKVNVPNSLLESFISLYLLADKEFSTTNKLAFEKYFMLFSIVQN